MRLPTGRRTVTMEAVPAHIFSRAQCQQKCKRTCNRATGYSSKKGTKAARSSKGAQAADSCGRARRGPGQGRKLFWSSYLPAETTRLRYSSNQPRAGSIQRRVRPGDGSNLQPVLQADGGCSLPPMRQEGPRETVTGPDRLCAAFAKFTCTMGSVGTREEYTIENE